MTSLQISDSQVSGRARSLANLRPFKPGQSGNPAGRPKNLGSSVTEWRNIMGEWTREQIEHVVARGKAPSAKVVAATEILKAMDGDLAAIRQCCEFTNGKARQQIQLADETTYVRRTVLVQADGTRRVITNTPCREPSAESE